MTQEDPENYSRFFRGKVKLSVAAFVPGAQEAPNLGGTGHLALVHIHNSGKQKLNSTKVVYHSGGIEANGDPSGFG